MIVDAVAAPSPNIPRQWCNRPPCGIFRPPRMQQQAPGSVRRGASVDAGGLLISKSKFLSGVQCSKLLWHQYNAKHLISEPDAAQQAIFDQGHEVGELAKQLFSDGIEVAEGIQDFDEILQRSQELVSARRPLFEAGFTHNGGYARADALNPVGDDAWDVIEVKSSTEVKDVNLMDLAFQAYVYAGSGLNVRRCILMHVNRDFVRHGPVDPRKFFKKADVTAQVSGLSRQIEENLDDMFGVIRQPAHPAIKIGPHCNDPYPCPLMEHCWSFLPDGSVMDLYRGGRKIWRLLDEGILAIQDIPDRIDLTDRQAIQRKVALSGQPHVDQKAVARFLKRLRYPVRYLDFETFGTAIPLFDGLRPYQPVAFQFSLHREDAPGGQLIHEGFLAEGRDDPRPEFLRQLKLSVETSGSVVVYNQSFERRILTELAAAFPEHREWIEDVKGRMVDLLEPFRAFDYYHPGQRGSASIKSVLPALTGRSYAYLEIQEGDTASREFVRVHYGDVPEAERQRVRRQLEDYCGQDTEGMCRLVEALGRLLR